MDTFEKLYQERRSTHNFIHNEVISIEKIKKILDIFQKNMPSKQDLYPYQIHVLDWNDFLLREKIYEGTLPNPGIHANFNNQIFAPIIIGFTHSLIDADAYIAPVEIGMAAMSIQFLLQEKSYATSFCGCITKPNEIGKLLTGKNHTTARLFLCVGIEKFKNYHDKVYNPFIDKFIKQKHRRNTANQPTILYHGKQR